jgi:hypothetical protein
MVHSDHGTRQGKDMLFDESTTRTRYNLITQPGSSNDQYRRPPPPPCCLANIALYRQRTHRTVRYETTHALSEFMPAAERGGGIPYPAGGGGIPYPACGGRG